MALTKPIRIVKTCNVCKIEKPVSEFNRNGVKYKNGDDVRKPFCKECRPKEDRRTVRKRNIEIRYSIKFDEIENLFESSKGVCQICNVDVLLYAPKEDKARVVHIDHCHKTGKVRGLLCSECNTGIGKFKENKEIMLKAILYLERFSS